MAEVKLHGKFSSPFLYRVIWALKIKGIQYEYVEEDLLNKSPFLLKYNPVYKKIPVLVHGGKPICESLIILEYIEEKWPQNSLLSEDPYQRAVARFWIKYAEDKGPSVWKMYRSSGEELEQGKKETLEMLQTMEERGLGEKFFGGDKIGMADIAIGALVHWMGMIEEVTGEKILEAHKFPRLHAWINNFREVPEIKENLPDWDKVLNLFKERREKLLATASSHSH